MIKAFRSGIAGLLVLALLLVPIAAGLAIELGPAVPAAPPPDAATAARARDVAELLQGVIERGAAHGALTLDSTEINALLVSAARLQPGIAGRARVEGDRLQLDLSAGAPLIPGGIWANVHLEFVSSAAGLRIGSARIGRLPLPPALVEPVLSRALDRALGDGLGPVLLGAVDRVRVGEDQVTVGFAFGPDERAAVYARLKDRVRALAGGTDAERIYAHLRALDRAGDRGQLPSKGSVLPYLVQAVGGPAQQRNREDLKAALLALTLYCGEDAFGPAVGATLTAGMQGRHNHCDGTTLGGRDDLKRHFVVSAGLYAARTGATAFGLGELKELLDSNPGGEGFSFDDIAADLAGARFAQAFLEATPAQWPALLDLIDDESDVLPRVDDLPSGLGEAEFRARFGDVDSPAYQAEIAEITRRISAMPLYGGLAN